MAAVGNHALCEMWLSTYIPDGFMERMNFSTGMQNLVQHWDLALHAVAVRWKTFISKMTVSEQNRLVLRQSTTWLSLTIWKSFKCPGMLSSHTHMKISRSGVARLSPDNGKMRDYACSFTADLKFTLQRTHSPNAIRNTGQKLEQLPEKENTFGESFWSDVRISHDWKVLKSTMVY